MFTGLDEQVARMTMGERQRQAEFDRLVEEAIRANRTQPGLDIRLLNLLSRSLNRLGQALVQTGERLEQHVSSTQAPVAYEEW